MCFLHEPVSINRFRPNIYGCEPFSEDLWKAIKINKLTFHGVKLCSRCKREEVIKMVVGSFSQELKSSVATARLWKAAVADIHNLLPKIAPQFISSMEVIEGDGGAGSIVLTTFAEAIKGVKSVKTRTDVMDEANFSYKYTVIEGNLNVFETISYNYKFEPLEDGETLCKMSIEYKTVGDTAPTEEEKSTGAETALNTLKGVEAYLLTMPDSYA